MKATLLALCATALFQTCFAQLTPVPPPDILRLNRDYPSMMDPTRTRPFFEGSPGDFSGKNEFTIILKNDSAIVSRTKINHRGQKHSVTVRDSVNKRMTIYPADTKGLIRIDESGNELYGIPTDSCWLFQSASGRINSFSFLAESGMENVIAIQYGDGGLILPLNKRNLLRMVGDEPRLVKLIEKGKLIKAIEIFNEDEYRELWRR